MVLFSTTGRRKKESHRHRLPRWETAESFRRGSHALNAGAKPGSVVAKRSILRKSIRV
jgi:hypothetical protein